MLRMKHQEITESILGAAFDVVNELGIGFLESVYEEAMRIALQERGHRVQTQLCTHVWFRNQCIGTFFADLIVDNLVLVELKAGRGLDAIHSAQVINYLNATGYDIGLLINFGSRRLEYRRLARTAVWVEETDPETPGEVQPPSV